MLCDPRAQLCITVLCFVGLYGVFKFNVCLSLSVILYYVGMFIIHMLSILNLVSLFIISNKSDGFYQNWSPRSLFYAPYLHWVYIALHGHFGYVCMCVCMYACVRVWGGGIRKRGTATYFCDLSCYAQNCVHTWVLWVVQRSDVIN